MALPKRRRWSSESLLAGAIAIAVLFVACSQDSQLTLRPWEKGQPFEEPVLEELVKPDHPVDSAGLYLAEDGRLYYVARLQRDPGLNTAYLHRYRELLAPRGFIIRPLIKSSHEVPFPSRTVGYEFLALRKGKSGRFSLLYRQFVDVNQRPAEDTQLLEHFPDPITLEDCVLVFRLGRGAHQPWRESVLVPEADLVNVQEFPFPRFPGAVLLRMSRPSKDGVLDPNESTVDRTYVVRGASSGNIISHYRRALRDYGLPVEPHPVSPAEISYRGDARRGIILALVRVPSYLPAPIEGVPLSFQELSKLAPNLVASFPTDVLQLQVLLQFADPDDAAPYWHPDDQRRRQEMLNLKPSGKKE